jgi:cobalt-zinc-cadmium resistance protein CzcA
VQERLQGIGERLPVGVDAPALGPLTGGLGEIYQVALSSPTRTQAELLELSALRVEPLLRADARGGGGERLGRRGAERST